MTEQDTRLAELALGLLDADERAAARRELETSPTRREELTKVRETLNGIGLASPARRPSDRLRSLLLDAVGGGDPFAGFHERLGTFLDLPVDRVREILGTLSSADAWEVDRPGTELHHFAGGPRVSEADCGLVRMAPGARYPAHRHKGAEWSFVLRGRAVEDETGVVWEPGDLVHHAPGSVHSFRVLDDEPFVFAIVLHEGIERP